MVVMIKKEKGAKMCAIKENFNPKITKTVLNQLDLRIK